MTALALLRGINVGRAKRVSMSGLRDALAAAGFGGASTYLQSGNVVLRELPVAIRPRDGAELDDRAVATGVEAVIADSFGFDVRVVVRSARQIAAVLAADPFAGVVTDPSRYLVTFLDGTPDPVRLAALDPGGFEPDRFEVRGTEIYSWLPDGIRNSALAALRWDRVVGATGTARNWNTVERLNALMR